MDWKLALKQIKQGSPKPVYLCYGTEKYLLLQFVSQLTKHVIDQEHLDWARTVYDLHDTPISHVLEDAQTPPFLAPKKCILAHNAMFCTGKDTSKVDHKLDLLLDYLENPLESTVFVLIVHAEKLDSRKKVVKTLKAMDAIVPFQPLRERELNAWIKQLASKEGVAIEDQAIEKLTVLAGANLETVRIELDKLLLFAGNGGRITEQIVEEMVSRSTEQNVFRMVEELVAVRVDRALDIYYNLLKQREEPIKILMLIARQIRIMLQVKGLSRAGALPNVIASQLGLHPYAVKISLQQCRRFEEQTLAGWLSELSELDFNMKTGRVDKVVGLEQFMLRMSQFHKG